MQSPLQHLIEYAIYMRLRNIAGFRPGLVETEIGALVRHVAPDFLWF
jgi:hypothetical protein